MYGQRFCGVKDLGVVKQYSVIKVESDQVISYAVSAKVSLCEL
ncbi:hypothetical protein COO91_04578 [Nostoc flagelliforme CCNUN1]|uniref:Uncharacterized protein n=1 Tax=Nostoc flagelliforme CCNUN1 TaxID=2038116 RepID=A0A2K8ST77_9NOSO|nr:hypothetical protein COO91_04578 [Nostoc flagelliforme CCNUN1]